KKSRAERAQKIAVSARAAGISEFKIAVQGGAAFSCPPGQTILAAANVAQLGFRQSCGEGACGTCRVRVLSGPFETDDQATFSRQEIEAGWVLACQTVPHGDLEIQRA